MKIKISLTNDDGETYVGETQLQKIEDDELDIIIPDNNPMKVLAKECNISVEKLKRVIEYDDNEFLFIGDLDESDLTKKRAIVCQCILTAWTRGKGIEWVDNSVLTNCLRKLGINVRNMNRSIDPKKGIFRTDGKKSGLKYALTIPGWKKGLEILKIESEKE